MFVWRVEHHCKNNPGHGPHVFGSCEEWTNRPDYGIVLESPHTDPYLRTIHPYESVGTLTEQFTRWWTDYFTVCNEWLAAVEGYSSVRRELTGKWFAVLYEVDEKYVRVGMNQVCFDRSKADVIYISQTDYPR